MKMIPDDTLDILVDGIEAMTSEFEHINRHLQRLRRGEDPGHVPTEPLAENIVKMKAMVDQIEKLRREGMVSRPTKILHQELRTLDERAAEYGLIRKLGETDSQLQYRLMMELPF